MATPFTHRNLKELEDSAVEHGLAPNLEARFARKALESERSGLSYQRLASNFSQPFGHRHGDQEETYVIVDGSGTMVVDGTRLEVGHGDVIVNRAGGSHGLENTGTEPLRLVVLDVPLER